jgi:hypothetical protein
MHDQMVAELTQIPQYQALKAMERCINEMSQIYEEAPESGGAKRRDFQEKLAHAVESRMRSDLTPAAPPKVTPYIPSQRVA